MNFSKVLLGLGGCVLISSLSGCFVEPASGSPAPAVYYGSITVDYTIEGSVHPSECAFANADQIEIAIRDSAGVFTTVNSPCENFGVTIDRLPEGTYEVDTTLLDTAGRAVSDTLVFPGADVVENTDLLVNVDFPTRVIH